MQLFSCNQYFTNLAENHTSIYIIIATGQHRNIFTEIVKPNAGFYFPTLSVCRY